MRRWLPLGTAGYNRSVSLLVDPRKQRAPHSEGHRSHSHDGSQIVHLRVPFGVEGVRFRRVVFVNLGLETLVDIRLAENGEEECGESTGGGVGTGNDGEDTITNDLTVRRTGGLGVVFIILSSSSKK